VKLRKPTPVPLYLELKDMLATLDSLREEGLWSSRQSGSAPDIGLSSVVLWLTYDAHVKLGLRGHADASLKRLKSELMLKLGEEVGALSDIHRLSTLEVLQCAVTVLGLWRGDADDLASKLGRRFSDEWRNLQSIMGRYTPYEHSALSLLVLVALYLNRRGRALEGLKDVLESYINSIAKSQRPDLFADTFALYWLTEVLRELANLEEYQGHVRDSLSMLEGFIRLHTRGSGKGEEVLEKLPLDKVLWLYLAVENLAEVEEKLRSSIDQELRALNVRLIKHITANGLIEWKESAYGRILRAQRDMRYIPLGEERLDTDLATLGLLIAAYTRMSRYIVTYVTEYDLRELSKLEKRAFFLGVTLTALGSFAMFSSLLAMVFPSLLLSLIQLQAVEIPYLHLNILQFFSIIFLISSAWGVNILYMLQRQEVKTPKDLWHALERAVNFVQQLKELSS